MKKLTDWINHDLPNVAESMASKQQSACDICSRDGKITMSTKSIIHEVLDELLEALFPGCYGHELIDETDISTFVIERLRRAATLLGKQVEHAYRHRCEIRKCENCDCEEMAATTVIHLIGQMPEIHNILMSDIQAAYEGDPAAISINEIILSYPFAEAIATHRIAHVLYERQVPLIPRIMSERAHSRTGIDIHPGAKIGRRFFIDHGTGVVIGETCVIGNNVKIYQGVTLGALSFPVDEDNKPIKGIKRHPNIEDDVTIYAGATILGGDTTMGRGSVIGGNVWLTHSVPPDSKIYNDLPCVRVVTNCKLKGGKISEDCK